MSDSTGEGGLCAWRDPDGTIEIRGGAAALQAMADALRGRQPSRAGLARCEHAHDTWFDALAIDVTAGPVTVVHQGSILVVEGAAVSLRLLGENVAHVASGRGGGHLHLEYFPDHPFFSPQSAPMIVTLDSK